MDYNKNIYKSLNEYSFACFHYLSTGYIELIAKNFPFILILDKKDLKPVSIEGKKVMNKMNNEKLVFYSYNDAAKTCRSYLLTLMKLKLKKQIN